METQDLGIESGLGGESMHSLLRSAEECDSNIRRELGGSLITRPSLILESVNSCRMLPVTFIFDASLEYGIDIPL